MALKKNGPFTWAENFSFQAAAPWQFQAVCVEAGMEALRRGASELCHEELLSTVWCLVELSVGLGGGLCRWIFQVIERSWIV